MTYYLDESVRGENELSMASNQPNHQNAVPELVGLLWRLADLHGALASGLNLALAETAITSDQFRVMASINELGSPTMGELNQKVGMANATLSRIVDSLEDQAFAYRLPNPTDRRRITVNLSDMGLERFYKSNEILLAWQENTRAIMPDSVTALLTDHSIEQL